MGSLERLSSFINWPSEFASVMSPIVLANAGFQYSGLGDRVRCPVCRIEIEGWQSGDLTSPAVEHRRRSPQCPLATQCAYPRDDGALVADVERMLKDQSLNERATSPHRLSSDVSCSPTNRSLNMTEVLNSAVRRAKTHGVVDPPPSTSSDAGLTTVDRTNPDYDLLKFESTRLGTFYDWPATAVAKPSDLAANGWFYTGQHDRVRCAFCRGVLHHWTKDDVPSSEHRRHFPDCPFVKGRDVGNVSLEHSEQTSVTEAVGTALKSAAERMSALGFDDGRWGAAGNSDESLRSDAIGSNSTNVARQTAVDRNADVTSSETHRRVAKSRDARSPEMNSESSAIEADEEQRLLEENRLLTAMKLCKVCLDKDVNTVFLPCGHLVTCQDCAPRLRDCPVCRTYIRGTVKTFLS